ncbi:MULTISPECIES: DUF6216 family protein [Stutzerimonas stutzeri subgroup]|uniref:DUF6216 family protein n=1 Tax=Stutzerimonas stutzeri subgroup TaxID=578833 RepID=UPI000775B0FE|nr:MULTISPECIES: DUF6216 family protein [Stutzerimonas stutzeri subgroup]KXO75503.1 hypothetical protein AYK87_19365 [Stutzerimonas stutzeri]
MSDLSLSSISFVATLLEVLGIIILIVIFIKFFLRAGSILFLKDRFWRLLGGKPVFHDVRSQLLFQELREIEHFRAEYGFSVSSLSDIDDYLVWRSRHNVPVGLFKDVASKIKKNTAGEIYLAAEHYGLKRFFGWAGLALCGVWIALSAVVFSTPYVLASFKATGERFYYGEGSFKLGLWASPVTLDQCKQDPISYVITEYAKRFTEDQLEMLCDGLREKGELSAYFEEQRSVQKGVAVVYLLLGAMMAWAVLWHIGLTQNVERLRVLLAES